MTAFTERRNHWRLGRHLAGFLAALIAGAFAPAAAHAVSPADPSLKAAYGFEEGSGTVVADNSGTGNTGTVAGPTWTTSGRFGNALTFDGVNDLVSVPDSDSLDLTTAMTLEAWVRPTELTRYRSVIMKEAATALVYALYAETSAAKPKFIVQQAGKLRWVDGPSQLPANTWTHLAATYDGFYFRLFINGTLAAQAGRSGPVTIGSGPLHIGGTLIYPEYFKGEIDEVRIYNRALTNAEVLTDMNTAVAGTADTLPPTTPQNFSATGSSPTSIATSWTASTDDRGVERYELFVNDVPYGTTTLTTHTIDMLSCSSTYQIGLEARDAAGNHSPRTTITASTTACDTTEPDVSLTAPTAGATVSGTMSVTANATDNDAVAGVQFYVDDQPLGAEDTSAPWSAPWNTRSAANGTHTLKARARDRSGNAHTSDSVQVTVENTTAPPADGLVAGWGFDDGSGSTAIDSSGNGNDGAVVGATWRTDGRIGGALEFDGVDDIVNVADADSLDLTSGLTLSAWVRPDILNGAWRTVLFKERSANITYGLYAHDNQLSPGPKPAGEITVGSAVSSVRGPGPLPLSTWSYLAYTYDGLQQRLYVDGVQVASAARTGPIATSTGALRIGGNTIWGERFDGLVDEVRIYNRALPQAEIEADMGTSVSTPDTVKPSAPTNLTAAGSVGRVTLNWTAATDDVGVTRYNVHRSTTPGFTPSAANRVAQPTSTSYADSGLAPNTYYYRVTAEDRAGNVSDASGEANGTAAPDTELPSVSVTEPAGGSTVAGAINVNASAADNDAVANVQFLLDGQALGSPDTSAPYSVSWNTRTAVNGPHTLSARATDASGNQRTADTVSVQVDNTTTPPPGLVASYGFDEGTGSTVSDASGNGNGGSKGGATWVPIGRIGGALSFDGIDDMITVPDSPTLDVTTGVTFSAWVRPDALGSAWRTVLFKQRDGGNLVYGGYANTGLAAVPNGELTIGSTVVPVKGTSKVPDGEWTHLATTYDGAQLNMYVNGALVGTVARTGLIATSSGALHVGGNETWGEYFDGLIDEVRIYDRALPAGEIQTDMITGVTPDSKAPTVTAVTPDADAAGLGVGTSVTATFSEAMDASSITTSTFALRDPSNVVVPATVTYNAATGKATLRPTSALHHNTRYTATLEGGASGSRVKDVAGNALAADTSWSFTTEPTPPPILVVDSAANPFSTYVGEIMRAEGLNGFSINDVSLVDAAYLSNFDVVVLGDVSVTASQVTALTNWVTAGGNLISLSPDKQLAGLLGLTDMGTTLDNGYLRVSTGSAPGAGIVAESIQYHGTADRYALNAGTTAVATLYTNASSPTSSPAVSLRSVGTNGGQAAAFTFDLARSTSLTRQGNPAWAGIERDGFTNSIRTNDLFYGATEPNWVDLNKIGIPQADELQRLFANVITFTNRDRTPVPRFWYLPRGEKAAVIMTGDDHADGGTAGRFDRYKSASPTGCSVENWECARMTSYIYPDSPLTNAQAAAYEAEGFEVSVHPFKAGCTNPTYAELDGYYTNRLSQFAAKYTSVPTPTTSRFHCVSWPDWDSHAKIEAAHGIRLDTNYYHFPPDRTTADGTVIPGWGDKPGFMTGSGFPMKFADLQGGVIDVYQAHTHLNDEGFTVPQTQFAIDFLLDHAIGAEGFYGMFTANEHTDKVVSAGSDAILASAQARAVPVISARQALRWVEGRNGSAFKEFTWSGGRLGFTVTVAPGATGIRGMLPIQSTAGNLTALTRDGAAVTLTARTIKGVAYAFFDASPGRYEARYGA